jgi:DNA-binding MarR family transcriptional regulator
MHAFWHSGDVPSEDSCPGSRPTTFDAQVEAVMEAAQMLVGLTARAMADVEEMVTLPQFRVLVMASADGPLNLRTVAAGLGVHPSNATRTCDRLVTAGLLDRRENADDRRQVALTLTDAGRRLLDAVMERRRAAIGAVLKEMPDDRRDRLAADLSVFSAIAGRVHPVGRPATR